MSAPGIPTAIKKASPQLPELGLLADVLEKYPEIQAVYLFGSTATGKMHRESDLDLAFVPRPGAGPLPKLDILADLAGAGFCDVDMVVIDGDDILLKYEAVRQNILVYQTDDFDRGTLYSDTVRKYLDFLPYLKVQREAYKRRVLSGQT